MCPKNLFVLTLMIVSAQVSCQILCRFSWGSILPIPRAVSEEVLSESVPTALPLDSMDISDFQIRWEGRPIEGVRFKLAPKTIQWVRVSEVLVIPRARLILDVDGVEGGQVSSGGFTQVFQDEGHAEIPVALVSGDKNPISITLKKGTEIVHEQDILGLIQLCHALLKPELPWAKPWQQKMREMRKELRNYGPLLRSGP